MAYLQVCLAAGTALAVSIGSAAAQLPCGKRDDIVKVLESKFQEAPAALGIAGQKNLFEVYASQKGSWTMLMTMPDGMTCIMASGQSWETIPYKPKLTGL